MKWNEPSEVVVPVELAAAVGGHPLVAQTLFRRGITQVPEAQAFMDPSAYHPIAPCELPDLAVAADRLELAFRRREKILVWGDFDVDGQTATALLVSALRDLAGDQGLVAYHIPVRAVESHGVNLLVLRQLLEDSQSTPGIKLLLTCDTGVSAQEAVVYAQQRGVDVVITDHHELPPSLPPALAVVNPRRLPAGLLPHPLATLPGVGVAYKLVEELYHRAGRAGETERYLDLVALGIVADVAPVTGESRYLLQCGLKKLRQPERVGFRVLLELAELNPASLTEEHIGFILAPRLNALGRLADANPAVEFLLTKDEGQARLLAYQLEGLNSRRKFLSGQVFQAALAQIQREPSLLEGAVLVLAHPTWHPGVIGIVASRLVDRFNKPAVLIATPPGEPGRGSARSVVGINIIDAISRCSDLMISAGGHAMAAGFAIEPEHIPEFRRALSAAIESSGPAPEAVLDVAAYLGFNELSLDLVSEIERLAPFGAGNPPLALACREVKVVACAPVGKEEEHLIVSVAPVVVETDESPLKDTQTNLLAQQAQAPTQRVIWWQGGPFRKELPAGKFDLAYTVRASNFGGQRAVQVEWVDYRLVESALAVEQQRPIAIVADHRQELHPLAWLEKYLGLPDLQIWVEGAGRARLIDRYPAQAQLFRGRDELQPGNSLLVWTLPPGGAEWQSALLKVAPQQLYLFAVDPENSQPEAFLQRLAGLAKFAVANHQGVASLEQLAVATAQTIPVVQKGLAWLAAKGFIKLLEQDDTQVRLGRGSTPEAGQAEKLLLKIQLLMDETRAFRNYFTRAEPESLIY